MNTVPPELDRRFREAAVSLLDVVYDIADSPVGPLFLGATPRGLCRISYLPDEHLVERLAEERGVRVLRSPKPLDPVRRQLDEYFEGDRHDFELELDLAVAPFNRRVLDELARVPFGETTTYGTLAARAEAPQAARAVGTVMNRNPIPIVLPCHRVVGANGSLTGYAGGLERKRFLLQLESGSALFV